jgi:hypothetical protein
MVPGSCFVPLDTRQWYPPCVLVRTIQHIVCIDLLLHYFPTFRKILSPIAGLSARTLFLYISNHVRNGTVTDTGS